MRLSETTIDIEETGKKLEFLAKRNGYSVKDIQEYLGLSCPQSIYRWYKGVILPSIDNLFRLSELYHMHMEDLLAKNNASPMDIRNCIILEYTALKKDGLEKRLVEYMLRLTA